MEAFFWLGCQIRLNILTSICKQCFNLLSRKIRTFKNYFTDFSVRLGVQIGEVKNLKTDAQNIKNTLQPCLLQSSCFLCRKWKHNQLFMGYYVAAGLPGRWHLQILKKCFMKQRILSQGLHNCSLMANMLPILYKYRISLYVYTLSKNLFSTLFYYF